MSREVGIATGVGRDVTSETVVTFGEGADLAPCLAGRDGRGGAEALGTWLRAFSRWRLAPWTGLLNKAFENGKSGTFV